MSKPKSFLFSRHIIGRIFDQNKNVLVVIVFVVVVIAVVANMSAERSCMSTPLTDALHKANNNCVKSNGLQ